MLTIKESIKQALDLLEQRDDVNEQLKALKDAINEAGFDAKAVISVATAIHNEKLEVLEDYTSSLTEAIEDYRKC